MLPFLIMSLGRSVTNHTPVSLEVFNISAIIPEGPAALPFFILIIAFTTISVVISVGGSRTESQLGLLIGLVVLNL